jgi:regulator of cell morphogenesis and NO signaling
MSTSTQSIREIVQTQPSAARVLERFEIDLCGQAEKSLDNTCAELQLSVDQVLEKLAHADAQEHGNSFANPETLSMERLIQHIVRVHHQCVRQELPRLAEMAQRLADKRSDRAPELRKVAADRRVAYRYVRPHPKRRERLIPVHCSDGSGIDCHLSASTCMLSLGSASHLHDGAGA